MVEQSKLNSWNCLHSKLPNFDYSIALGVFGFCKEWVTIFYFCA